MINIAVFASGEGTNAENLFSYYAGNTGVKIKLVVTNNEQAGVIKRADAWKKNVQLISKTALYNYTDQIVDFLKTEKVDMIVLAGFLLKIPEALIRAYPDRIINIHPALLPKFGGKGMYGMHVHCAVIEAGEKESGITVHYVNEEYDKGRQILQVKCLVEAGESPESLAGKIHELEYHYFPRAIDKAIAEISTRTY